MPADLTPRPSLGSGPLRPALCLLLAGLALAPTPSLASPPDSKSAPWTFTSHVVMTGSSDEAESDPPGYKVYSAFSIDAAVQRRVGSRLALEMSIRTESREIDRFEGDTEALRLGSVEVLPVSLLLQYRPSIGDRVRPYVGAGLNLTVVWEKSGRLDSTDLTPTLAPAVQLGMDVRLSARVFLNVDLKWNPWRPDLESEGVRIAQLKADPLALGLGVGFRF